RLAARGAPIATGGYLPPLLAAVENSDAAMVKLLLSLGADPLGGEFPVLKMAQQRASTPESKAVLSLLKAAAAARKPAAAAPLPQ
ncbi:ankyrin repeat domain-containing protein, partial [Janthinobacterium sp. BJB401]|uniref:ankyrin repeat domain-containing protein n=1 Tax=Janthinobacterium sp. BJB401 TaxID=2745934 RepID=UPI0015957E2B